MDNVQPQAPNKTDNSSKKILIVEDDQFLRDFYQELLVTEGYTVDVAEDGDKAWTKAHEGGWDLILLDIMLPKKDGLEILQDLKTQPPQKPNSYIVVLTNLGSDTVVSKAFNLGANGFLIKSALNPDEILNEIHSFLAKAHP